MHVPESTPLAFAPPVEVQCRPFCAEPTIAVDGAGRIFVTPGVADTILLMVSADQGRTFQPVPGPPPPAGAPGPIREDAIVQAAPDGSLWFSALVPALAGSTDSGPPKGANYRTLQVARSTDGGLSWSPNLLFEPGTSVDRQWLGFGKDRLFLTWQSFGEGVGVARSDDGGLSFHTLANLDDGAVTGVPCVLPSGRVLFPVIGNGLAVRRSDDAGVHWTPSKGLGTGAYFPSLSCAGPVLRVAWWTKEGIHVAASRDDGVAWTLEPEWEGRLPAPSVSPWLVERGGTAVASFRTDADGTHTLQVQRRDAAGFHNGTVTTGIASYFKGGRANTDFASMAALADGRLVVVWSPTSTSVRVAVEQR
ncbi:MAG: hypothetical protein QOG31_1470 [Thermoplasmata archaeon]|nr:hypothetical protein [Thermoplasmata archaeon]